MSSRPVRVLTVGCLIYVDIPIEAIQQATVLAYEIIANILYFQPYMINAKKQERHQATSTVTESVANHRPLTNFMPVLDAKRNAKPPLKILLKQRAKPLSEWRREARKK